MFYNIPSPKVYINNQGAGFILITEKLAEEDIRAILVNSSYNKEKRKPLKELIQKYIKLENPVKLKANYAVFIY